MNDLPAAQPMINLSTNPLLDFTGLPRFDEIRPEHVGPAIATLIAECKTEVEHIEQDSSAPDWGNCIVPLENVTERLGRAWKSVDHVNSLVDTPELRAAYNENLPAITEFWTALSQNLALFEKYRAISQSPAWAQFSPVRCRVIENALRDFRLGGAELPQEQKKRFAEIQERQAAIAQKFSENVLDATNAFALYVDNEVDLAGLPPDAIAAARERAVQEGKPGYKITLHMPSYLAVMQFADSRSLRETIYAAYAKRASEFGPAEQDNTALITETLKLRHEEAQLLGYASFAEVSLVSKMAGSPKEVLDFLTDMGIKARPYGERDVAELSTFAKTELGIDDLQSWDLMYASEKLREQRYAFSEQEVKQYFPEHKVLEGLFRVIETLFSVHIRPDSAPLWHADARFFRVEDASGSLVAQFYLDLYARSGKRGGAWMDDARTRRRKGEQIQTPIAFLTCNFSAPIGGKPALFSHDEVTTLFHEFGHGLHHMLTQVEEAPVAGINGVEWDAVELPSQFLENFCWEWDVIRQMTAHVETGEALPRVLFDKMLAAKNFQAGMQTLRQIEFSTFDMRLHDDFDPNGEQTCFDLLEQVRQTFAVVRPPAYNRFPNQFTHIFAGGYAAGYYSYKWAEVLSADAYAQFEEHMAAANDAGSILDTRVGTRFRDEILAVGGSRPAAESFRAFRGREPSIDALLRHNGMIAENTPLAA